MADALTPKDSVPDRFALLSDRETEVLRLAADGLKPKAIAQRLKLSERTIYAHLSSAAKKLGVSGPGEAAVALARREARGAHSKSAEQPLQLAPTVQFLIDLFVPELGGRHFNDLNLTRRVFVIVTRTIIVAFTLLVIAGLVRDVGQAFSRSN